MNDEHRAFLDAIAAAPCDCQLRAIYADWLEERGEIKEAILQRRWPEVMAESRAWLTELGQKIGGRGYYDKENDPPLTCDQLIQVALAEVNYQDDDLGYMGTNERYSSLSNQTWEEFWNHVEVLTGRRKDGDRCYPFSCGC